VLVTVAVFCVAPAVEATALIVTTADEPTASEPVEAHDNRLPTTEHDIGPVVDCTAGVANCGGIVSATENGALVADGPSLVTVIVHVASVPTSIGFWSMTLLIRRSLWMTIVLVTVEELLAGVGSGVVVVTEAVLDSVPVVPGATCTSTNTSTDDVGGSEPKSHDNVPVATTHVPIGVLALMNVVPAGNGSLSFTAAAIDGPALATWS
jgi:hypothetical protein